MGANLKDGKWVYDNMQIGLVNSTFKTLICTNVVQIFSEKFYTQKQNQHWNKFIMTFIKGHASEDCIETFLIMPLKS